MTVLWGQWEVILSKRCNGYRVIHCHLQTVLQEVDAEQEGRKVKTGYRNVNGRGGLGKKEGGKGGMDGANWERR